MTKIKPVILIGGKSRRLGKDKVHLRIKGNSILCRTFVILKNSFGVEPLLVGREVAFPSLHSVPDKIKNAGPLGGLYTAFCYSNTETIFLTACDMPFIKMDLVVYMRDTLKAETDIYIPRFKNGMVEPLFAFYSRRLFKTVQKLLQEKKYPLRSLLPLSNVQYIEEKEIEKIDPEFLSFFNINTKNDLDRVTLYTNEKRKDYSV